MAIRALWEVLVTTASFRFTSARRVTAFIRDRRIARTPDEATRSTPQFSRAGGVEATSVSSTSSASSATTGSGAGATRRRVIEAGARVFADIGFHAATKERIGAAAGYSHQTVRDYFRTKDGLLAAIVCDVWRNVLEAVTSRPEDPAVEQILAGYDALDTLSRTHPAEARCALHEAQIAGANGRPLVVEEERVFKKLIEHLVTSTTGIRGAAAFTRAEILVAAMAALTRPNSSSSAGDAQPRYSPDDARRSFRLLTETMLQPAS